MDLLPGAMFSVAITLLVWLLHTSVGKYPMPFPRSKVPKKEILGALLLWGIAIGFSLLGTYFISPWLVEVSPDRTVHELLQVPLLTAIFVIPPLLVIIKRSRWRLKDFGLTLRTKSTDAALFAAAFGLATGGIGFATGQTMMGAELMPVGALLLLIYNNSFIEEFYYRGVIQSKLERAVGQGKAVLWGGILFGLAHIVFDVSMLIEISGVQIVVLALILQTLAGWLLGIIYTKSRTLWPGVTCHYLSNWLPSIIALIVG